MTANTQNINAKSVAKYLLLPGIIPRAKELAGSGFGYLAFLFARVYGAVRILPPGHPFMDPANIGKFTVLQAIAAAANNLTFKKRNIDQLIVFVALLVGLVLMVLQFVLLILTFISGDAFAGNPTGGVNFLSMFVTQNPQTDVAFLMLDYVFGIPGAGGGTSAFFGSNALIPNGPTPFHLGMQALFQFYNLAILLVGVVIFAYYVFVVVIETAQTGVPFGRRFSKLYAPLRLVIAIGLLIPLNYGFNGAQYITLTVAKMGSSFATNGWLLYNASLSGPGLNPLGIANTALVARPRQPYLDDLLQFSSVYHTCREMYRVAVPNSEGGTARTCIGAYVMANGQPRRFTGLMGAGCDAGGLGNILTVPFGGGTGANYDYEQAKRDLGPGGGVFGTGDIEIILGEYDPQKHSTFNGSIKPYCGKMTISLNHNNPRYYTGPVDRGTIGVEKAYYNLVRMMLNPSEQIGWIGPFSVTGFGSDDFNLYRMLGERSAHTILSAPEYNPCLHSGAAQGVPIVNNPWGNIFGGIGNIFGGFFGITGGLGDAATCNGDDWAPQSSVFQGVLDNYKLALNDVISESYASFVTSLNLAITDDQQRRGWGGAGIWYNQIADLNGGFTGAIYSTPSVREFPEVMVKVKDAKAKEDKTSDYCGTFDPNLANGKSVELKNNEYDIAKATNQTFRYFCDRQNQETGNAAAAGAAPGVTNSNSCSLSPLQQGAGAKGATSNVFMDVVSLIFGLNGLFDLKACSMADPITGHPRVHPLAQLSTIGKSLVENAIRSMGMALGASFGGGILGVLNSHLGSSLQAASGMFVSIATIGLSVGFILYYILPFLPFIYFFFAVGAWVKSIFEAMVGVPLWALAHLHIDGDGLPGKAAMPGYWLLFEIFLRPIVTVFGLIGGMACFGALTVALNSLFDQVITNATGAPPGAGTTELSVAELSSLRAGTVDQFFYTVMYAILVYLMATASFKMIDTVPKAFMRWMNTGVSTFNDNKGDPTSDLTTYAAVGGARVSGQLLQGLNSGVGGVGKALGEIPAALSGGKEKQ